MANRAKILFLTLPTGSGHTKAAQALAEETLRRSPGAEVQVVNVFSCLNPLLSRLMLGAYLKLLNFCPQVYGNAYKWGNNSFLALRGRMIVSGLLASQMQSFILAFQPDVIICTHAAAAGLVCNLIRAGRLKVPVLGVVTDFTVHRLWLYPEVSHYFVADDKLAGQITNFGIKRAQISAFGIPVARKFSRRLAANGKEKPAGRNGKVKKILIMGGGYGVLPMDKIAEIGNSLTLPLELFIITGYNHQMMAKIIKLIPALNKPVHLFGFTDKVPELMTRADIIISKPGGMTTAETLCCGLPMIIYQPIPGQEEENARFLTERQVAWRVDSLAELKLMLEELLISHPEKVEQARNNMINLNCSRSAAKIMERVFEMYVQV